MKEETKGIIYAVTEVYYNESAPNDVEEIKRFTKAEDALRYCDKLNERAPCNTDYAVIAEWAN